MSFIYYCNFAVIITYENYHLSTNMVSWKLEDVQQIIADLLYTYYWDDSKFVVAMELSNPVYLNAVNDFITPNPIWLTQTFEVSIILSWNLIWMNKMGWTSNIYSVC